MKEIDKYIEGLSLDTGARAIVKRVIHASGDPALGVKVKIHPQAVQAGLTAIRGGADIYTDVNMVRAGINLKRLRCYGGTVHCAVHRPGVKDAAEVLGITRSAAAMRLYGTKLDNQLVVVGNAPTALFEVLKMVDQQLIKPALIVGIPVGFVGAAESKDLLVKLDVPYITIPGTRGGSPLAVAVVNALIYLMER